MNPTEQTNHKNALRTLERDTADAFDALTSRLATEHRRVVECVGEERTHRLKLADEQRAYVDAADRELQRSMVASDDNLGARIKQFESMTLWNRLRWFVMGRIS